MVKTQQEVDAGNQFGAYQRGWITGAKFSAMDVALAEHLNPLIQNAYISGYSDGQRARSNAFIAAADRFKHRVNVLRLAPLEEVSECDCNTLA